MFRMLDNAFEQIEISLDDKRVSVPRGISVATALLYLDVLPRQTTLSGSPRAPFCMMGVCFECLIEINGVSQRACQVEVGVDMQIRRINANTAS